MMRRPNLPANDVQPVIDVDFLTRLRAWTFATFGPPEHRGPEGPLDHLRKEVKEVEEHPGDLMEWVDVILLGFDGAARGGHTPEALLAALHNKFAINQARDWPDWRNFPGDVAITHVRVDGEQAIRIEATLETP